MFLKLADMVPFPTNSIQGEKKCKIYLVCKQIEKTMFMLFIALYILVTMLYNLQESFPLKSPNLH